MPENIWFLTLRLRILTEGLREQTTKKIFGSGKGSKKRLYQIE
jgi:hypothetical protein